MNYKGFGAYDKKADFDFLKELNTSLSDLNDRMLSNHSEDFPNIFILGAPRSGTTFISQLIHNNLDVCTINNLSSKFWDAPIVGAHLSKLLLGDQKKSSYQSDYASTDGIMDPHEFSYFWRKHLLLTDPYNYHPKGVKEKINWEELKETLININHVYNKCGVYKTLEYTGYFLPEFTSLFKKSIFIYIKRDVLSVAKSIYKARERFNDNLEDWWASVPLEYQELKDKSCFEQIAGQIYYIEKLYEDAIEKTGSNRIIRVDYKNLCSNPQEILDQIVFTTKKNFNFDLKQINSCEKFEESIPSVEDKIETELKLELEKYYKF